MHQRPQRPTDLPSPWTVEGKRTKSGQAITVPVRHEDGRRGVYRELRTPLDDVAIRRFERELRLLSQVVQHKCIVTLFDWAAGPDAHWYISERGDSFPRWWRRKKSELLEDPPALVACAVSVLHDLSSALSLCHANGIVHRDIKSKNIVVKATESDPMAHPDRFWCGARRGRRASNACQRSGGQCTIQPGHHETPDPEHRALAGHLRSKSIAHLDVG